MAISFGLCGATSDQNVYKNLNAGVQTFWPDDGLHIPKLVAII
jgi:hypothetical protein